MKENPSSKFFIDHKLGHMYVILGPLEHNLSDTGYWECIVQELTRQDEVRIYSLLYTVHKIPNVRSTLKT